MTIRWDGVRGRGRPSHTLHIVKGLLILNPIPKVPSARRKKSASFVLQAKRTLMQTNDYDLIVIGSGPAGQKGAICAAKMAKEGQISDRRPPLEGRSCPSRPTLSKVL